MARPELLSPSQVPAIVRSREAGGLWFALHAAWSVSCIALLVLLIGIRWLRYTSWAPAPEVDRLLGSLMILEQQAFLWPWVYTALKLRTLLLAAAIVALALHRRLPGLLVGRVDGAWRLTPLAVSIVLGVMVWWQYFFDVNPAVARMCFTSLVLVGLAAHPRIERAVPRVVMLVLCAGAFLGWLALARDSADRVAVVVWAGVLAVTYALRSFVGRRELVLLRVLAIMPMNFVPALLPVYFPTHGGTVLGDGLAYAFCEIPKRRSVYATIPVCDTPNTGYEDCRPGRVVEYDLRTMKRVDTLDFITPDFYGRLELMACVDDEVQVVVQGAVYHDRKMVQAVLSFPVDSPKNFSVLMADKGLGMMIAYDQRHDAFFYSGEFNNPLVRYDRRTKQLDESPSRDFIRTWYQPVLVQENTGSLSLHTSSVDPGGDRLYVADWMQGRNAYAVDMTTLRPVASYAVNSGGAIGLTVDPERNRIFVSSVWGLEVVDVTTGAVVARKRMGLGNRPVVVDAARNRLYVSSMVEGKIRILDRDTLDVIGQLPVGLGPRYPYLSLDGRYLFASSTRTHYYWDADMLPPALPPRSG